MNETKAVKRGRIIEIAAKEFAEKGYDNSNINRIAVLSGIGKGSIYLYFKTKKDLYLATMTAVVEKFNKASTEVLNMDCSAIEKLKICIESLFRFEEEGLPFLVLWSRYQFQNNPDFQEDVFLIFEDIKQPFCEIVREGVENKIFNTPYPEASGYLILSMVTMLIPSLQQKPLLSDVDPEKKVQFVLNIVKNGLNFNSGNIN